MYDADFKKYQAHATKVYGAEVSKDILKVGHALKTDLPDRVGGHDDARNQTGGAGQKGGGASASDHGKAQGNRWLEYRREVERHPKYREVAARLADLKKQKRLVEKDEKKSTSKAKAPETTVDRRHDEKKREEVAAAKAEAKAEKADAKGFDAAVRKRIANTKVHAAFVKFRKANPGIDDADGAIAQFRTHWEGELAKAVKTAQGKKFDAVTWKKKLGAFRGDALDYPDAATYFKAVTG